MDQNGKNPLHIRHKVTMRDRRILEFISKNPRHNFETLRLEFWPGKNSHHHYRRIRILQHMGLVDLKWTSLATDNIQGWGLHLTRKGQRELTKEISYARKKLVAS